MNDLLFIAEIGSNFFGSIGIAKYLMDKAKESGATHAKFQLFKADDLYKPDWEYYSHAKLCELRYDKARVLKDYADSIDIGWFCSVHTKKDIDFLVNLIGVDYIKIKASQCNDHNLIKDATSRGMDVILSNPNSMITSWKGVINLLTTDKYPSKWTDIPFNQLRSRYCDGFSDHTQGIQASLCASMYNNINIFEFHFTDKLLKFGVDETKTPDFCVSKYPEEVSKMISRIKHIKNV